MLTAEEHRKIRATKCPWGNCQSTLGEECWFKGPRGQRLHITTAEGGYHDGRVLAARSAGTTRWWTATPKRASSVWWSHRSQPSRTGPYQWAIWPPRRSAGLLRPRIVPGSALEAGRCRQRVATELGDLGAEVVGPAAREA